MDNLDVLAMEQGDFEPGDVVLLTSPGGNTRCAVTLVKRRGRTPHPELGWIWLIESETPIMSTSGEALTSLSAPENWLKKITPSGPISFH